MTRAWFRGASLAALFLCAPIASGVVMQPSAEVASSQRDARVDPLPAGESRALEALVISVEGSARWRQSEDEEFRALRVDDILRPGAEIRTSLRSNVVLRVGHNATAEISGLSHVFLPEMVQDGEVLRTRAGVRTGRMDIKVDKVGLANDFEVVTPSTTLAVRGTFFGISHGGLSGTRVHMFDPGELSAAEVRYFTRTTRSRVLVRNNQTTSEAYPDPVINALFNTISPPPDQAVELGSDRRRAVDRGRVTREVEFEDERQLEYRAQRAAEVQIALGITPEDPRRRPDRPNVRPRPGDRPPLDPFPPGINGGSGNPGGSFSGDPE